jgi:hypothetical protein
LDVITTTLKRGWFAKIVADGLSKRLDLRVREIIGSYNLLHESAAGCTQASADLQSGLTSFISPGGLGGDARRRAIAAAPALASLRFTRLNFGR